MFIKRILLLSLLCGPASAQMVTPRFTTGSVQSTTNTTIDIDRTVETTIYGGATSTWSGTNVTASGDISNSSTTFSMTTAGDPFQLEITTRAAGMIEESLLTETIEQVSTTNSLSVFSQ
jgi:hypothetical protein